MKTIEDILRELNKDQLYYISKASILHDLIVIKNQSQVLIRKIKGMDRSQFNKWATENEIGEINTEDYKG